MRCRGAQLPRPAADNRVQLEILSSLCPGWGECRSVTPTLRDFLVVGTQEFILPVATSFKDYILVLFKGNLIEI